MSSQNPPEPKDNVYGSKDGGSLSQDFRLKRNSMNEEENLEPSDTSSVGSYEKFRLCAEDIELIAEATSSKVYYRMQAHALKLHAEKLRWLTEKF